MTVSRHFREKNSKAANLANIQRPNVVSHHSLSSQACGMRQNDAVEG